MCNSQDSSKASNYLRGCRLVRFCEEILRQNQWKTISHGGFPQMVLLDLGIIYPPHIRPLSSQKIVKTETLQDTAGQVSTNTN